MSSVPQHQQHLTSADMNMIMRVHAGVCTRNAIAAGSLDAKRLAALLVWEFQHGVSSRMGKFIGNSISEWEAERRTVARTPSPRSHIDATA
ncbi:hypothetical protein [Mesorhizobium sp. GR13]|uniref:hypothetical protein n=1 Tax=Mesorhizobium sp. GR13 TaxID=2562308 RepID=UPI0010C0ACB4|nr:hypothetical protein [Mesorhizobium sp. GR13]